jgi:hypothetical protein
MSNRNWEKKKELPMTQDNVVIERIEKAVFLTPSHGKCEECKRNKLPLMLSNPKIRRLRNNSEANVRKIVLEN